MNSMAGGGTILTFPALVWVGLAAKVANATSTVALVPGALASFFGYRDEALPHRAWLRALIVPSLFGGAAGSLLLLATPEHWFERLAPGLVLFATLLFAWQSRGAADEVRPAPRPEETTAKARLVAAVAQFLVALYGGYFGAGIGILMLAILTRFGLSDVHAMNGLKNLLGVCINGVAALVFVASGSVDWPTGGAVFAGAVVGGYGGARLARRIGQTYARRAVVLIGLFVAALLFARRI